MDNDGALLEVLRNTYKGLRFRWKYRGLIILPAEQGNAAAADAIRAGQPFLFGRCGATEMRTVAEYLTGKYTEKTRGEINTLSGVFPTDDKALNRFCKLYTSCAQGADLLALWDVGAERQVIDGCHGTRFTQRWNHIIMPTPGAPHWPESMCWWYTPLRIPSAPSTKSAGSCSPTPPAGETLCRNWPP